MEILIDFWEENLLTWVISSERNLRRESIMFHLTWDTFCSALNPSEHLTRGLRKYDLHFWAGDPGDDDIAFQSLYRRVLLMNENYLAEWHWNIHQRHRTPEVNSLDSFDLGSDHWQHASMIRPALARQLKLLLASRLLKLAFAYPQTTCKDVFSPPTQFPK